MGALTAKNFASWLHPGDVLDGFIGLGEEEAEARITAMLSDGILRAAAEQLIIDGQDLGLHLIPRELWPFAARTDVWITGRFRLTLPRKDKRPWTASAYGVRVDRDYQPVPPPFHADGLKPATPLPEATLTAWAATFFAERPTATEADARRALSITFPGKTVSRERVRRIMPPRRPGRPLKKRD